MGNNSRSNTIAKYIMDVQIKDDPYYNSAKFLEQVIAEGNYTYHMDKLVRYYDESFIKVPNKEKQAEFDDIKLLLEKHFVQIFDDEPLEKYDLKYADNNLEVLLTIRFEMIINEDGNSERNKSNLFTILFTKYQDNFIEIEDNKYIKMCFTIKLCDVTPIEENEENIKTLVAKCKVRMNYDMNK